MNELRELADIRHAGGGYYVVQAKDLMHNARIIALLGDRCSRIAGLGTGLWQVKFLANAFT